MSMTTTGAGAGAGAATEDAALDLNFEAAMNDSPVFRATLQRVEDEVDKLSTWLEGVCKALRSYTDELNRRSMMSGHVHHVMGSLYVALCDTTSSGLCDSYSSPYLLAL